MLSRASYPIFLYVLVISLMVRNYYDFVKFFIDDVAKNQNLDLYRFDVLSSKVNNSPETKTRSINKLNNNGKNKEARKSFRWIIGYCGFKWIKVGF